MSIARKIVALINLPIGVYVAASILLVPWYSAMSSVDKVRVITVLGASVISIFAGPRLWRNRTPWRGLLAVAGLLWLIFAFLGVAHTGSWEFASWFALLANINLILVGLDLRCRSIPSPVKTGMRTPQ